MRYVKKAIVKIYWEDNGVCVVEQKIANNVEELRMIVRQTESWEDLK